MSVAVSPTKRSYGSLDLAYDFFNRKLFGGELPRCLITLQRHKGAYGYFSPERFQGSGAIKMTDEIALNPSHFATRPSKQVLSTLAHEMAHLWQQHFGEPPRRCYHDREWAAKMEQIGLIPSSTGAPGGKKTGQSCSHYIEKGGRFDVVCDAFLAQHEVVLFHDRAGEIDKAKKATKSSKTKYTCPGCGLNAWAKPNVSLKCGDCDEELEAEESDE